MSNSKKYIPLLLGLALAAGILIGDALDVGVSPMAGTNARKTKVNQLLDYIDYHYVDEVDTDSIVDVTVGKILESLDPHSVYIPSSDVQGISESMQGNFVGIGVSLYTINDTIAVINTIKGGPSEEAGVQAGDRIIAVDDIKVTNLEVDRDSLMNSLRGERGSVAEVKIYRPKNDSLVSVNIRRGDIPISSLDASYMVNDTTGYIRLNRFAETTFNEYKKAQDELIKQGMKTLVFDLRDNPGGVVSSALGIADEFLEKGELIMFTKDKGGKEEYDYATATGDFEQGSVILLVDENTASASEIISGAIQDNDRGTIVGRRTFGKGLVQQDMKLADGSSVRLTISRYYTPVGRSIQRPYDQGTDAYYRAYENRLENGEVDPNQISDSLKFTTEGGKIVYGGGGITPDVIIDKDINFDNQTLRFLYRTGLTERFVFNYLDNDRSAYDGMSFGTFNTDFSLDDDIVTQLEEYLDENKMKLNLKAYNSEVLVIIKATMADQLYGSSEAWQIRNDADVLVQQVLTAGEKED